MRKALTWWAWASRRWAPSERVCVWHCWVSAWRGADGPCGLGAVSGFGALGARRGSGPDSRRIGHRGAAGSVSCSGVRAAMSPSVFECVTVLFGSAALLGGLMQGGGFSRIALPCSGAGGMAGSCALLFVARCALGLGIILGGLIVVGDLAFVGSRRPPLG